ncbi:MAG TPA: endolytic transglycosylase MltG [Patescibacteria group bacterium]|nr:endolytic transglycosylase MltG [Patescibacteria group bacterium]
MRAFYSLKKRRLNWLKVARYAALALVALALVAAITIWRVYESNIRPLDHDQTPYNVVIPSGSTPIQIGNQLKTAGLIRSPWAFEWYTRFHGQERKLQAGTYAIKSSESVAQIATTMEQGKIVRNLVIILPAQRLDQIKDAFTTAKFDKSAVDKAFDPAQYNDISVLSDKPASASLEGYLYPDTFQRDPSTDPAVIIRESLQEMNQHVTPDIRSAFASEGLSVYQGITLASIVEQEVSKPADRTQVAQVFLSRLKQGTVLGSDVTYFYSQHVKDTAYDTTSNKGLPPGPISNVSDNSLQAVAHPASTNWLYFVTGDDGTTYFSTTLDEHNQQIQKYCHKLCTQP